MGLLSTESARIMPERQRPSSRKVRLPRLAVVNDYELVVAGVAAMLAPYKARLTIAEAILVDEPVQGPPIDLALYDTFGREGMGMAALKRLLDKDKIRRVAVYTTDMAGSTIGRALRAGVGGYLSKASPADQLADQIERVIAGEVVVETNGQARQRQPPGAHVAREARRTVRTRE